jgi:ATP-binding cassette, subfamily B, bacterial
VAWIFDGLDVEAYDRSYSDVELVRRILRYFRTQRRRVALVTGTVLLITIAEIAQPLIIAQGVGVLASNPAPALLAVLVVAVYVSACAAWATNLVRRRATGRAVGDMVRDMRVDAFEAAVARDMSFYDEFASGKIVSRITSDTQDFAQMLVLVTDLIGQIMVLLVMLGILLAIEWRLTMVLIVLVPLIMGSALLFRRIARRVSRKASRALANVNSNIQETIAGISVAKNFRQEAVIYRDFEEINRQAYLINWRRGVILSLVFPTLNTLSGVGTAVLVYYGALSVLGGVILLSGWLLFIRAVQYFWDPLTSIASFWSQFQAGLASAERIFALIDAPNVVVQTDNQPVASVKGEIAFKRVRFQYSKQEIVLPGLDLHIQPGETVALVGHTGAGKSSITKLAARFYEFQSGDLLIDGRDIRTLNLTEYRRHLGIVSQVPFLFAGTVSENIRYAKLDATETDIEAMAYRIGGGDWLETLPQGLQTDVGERGSRLSMGQRQLVVLTRVLVQNPSIFILDEATASIDPFTESQIQQALNLILANRTSILIAHRLSTVRSADRIIVLRKGEIIEQGNHESLMQDGGHYAELYNTYFRHQSLEYIESAENTLSAARS